MKHTLLALLAVLVFSGSASAQSSEKPSPTQPQAAPTAPTSVPAARPDDVKSIESIKNADGSSRVRPMSVEDYAKGAGNYFLQHAFFESPIVNRIETFGNITQVFSSYESRHAAGEAPFARGINSIQLLNDGTRWWIISILWDEERPDNPLPKEFAAKSTVSSK